MNEEPKKAVVQPTPAPPINSVGPCLTVGGGVVIGLPLGKLTNGWGLIYTPDGVIYGRML